MDGRTDGQTLFYSTLQATAGGPKTLIFQSVIIHIKSVVNKIKNEYYHMF